MNFTIGAGETQRFTKPGRFFKLTGTTGPVTIEFFKGAILLPESGYDVEAGFGAVPPGGFDTFTIYSATSQTVSAFITMGAVTYDRMFGSVVVASGSITAADNEKVDAIAGRAFSTAVEKGAVAAEYAHVQIFNPAASGVRVIVRAIEFMTGTTSGSNYIGHYNTALTTLVKQALSTLSAGAAGKAALRMAGDASSLVATDPLARVGAAAGVHTRFEFKAPVVLLEGKGLVIVAGDVNTYMRATIQHTEETL